MQATHITLSGLQTLKPASLYRLVLAMAARLLLRSRSRLSSGLLPLQFHPKTSSCLALNWNKVSGLEDNVSEGAVSSSWQSCEASRLLLDSPHALPAAAAAAAAAAAVKSAVGFMGDGGVGGSKQSSCFSGGEARSLHTGDAPARVARRPDRVPESQHDLHLEHTDIAHVQRWVRPFKAPVVLEAPVKLLYELLQNKGFIDAKTRPLPVDQVASQDDHRIVAWYRSIAIGLLKYHSFCDNLSKVRSIVNYFLRWSAIYTLAKKHKSSSSQIIAKHTKSLVISKDGKTLAAYLTPTEISEYKKRFIVELDPTPPEELIDMLFARLVQKRLLVERCAVKGCQQRHVEMHHLRQIEKAGGRHKVRSAREAQILEGIKALQATLNKKHIPLCVRHHDDLHMGKVFLDDLDMNVVI